MIWHEQRNFEVWPSLYSKNSHGRNNRPTASNWQSTHKQESWKPYLWIQCEINDRRIIQDKKGEDPKWSIHQTSRLIFSEWDLNVFMSKSLRLTSMPTPTSGCEISSKLAAIMSPRNDRFDFWWSIGSFLAPSCNLTVAPGIRIQA